MSLSPAVEKHLLYCRMLVLYTDKLSAVHIPVQREIRYAWKMWLTAGTIGRKVYERKAFEKYLFQE